MNKTIRTTNLATRIVVLTCILLSTAILNMVQAQLTGTKNIPGDYPTLAAAIADLNTQGVGAGGVTFNLLAGNPQAVPAGGYVVGGVGSAILIGANATSITKQVIFQGNLNVLTASAALVAGDLTDGIFKLIGADWITIQGFNMQENAANVVNTPAASNNMTEWGVALLYVSLTDGSQNNTIQNNTIALNRTYQNSFGIYSNVRHSATDVITLADITDPTTGPNNSNKVYGNTINNINIGMVFIGSATAANMDNGNDLGGASLVTANSITNYGGLGALSAYNGFPTTIVVGAYLLNQNNFNLSFNSFISASLNTAVALRGILTDYSAVPIGSITNNVNSNTVTFTQAGTGTFQCITTASTAGIAANVILNLNQNLIINNALTAPASALTIFGVANLGAFGTVNMNSNIVRANTSTATTGGFIAITQQGAVVNTVSMNNNQIGDAIAGAATFTVATTGQINPILNTMAAATATVNINNNVIRGFSVVGTGQVTAVSNQAAAVGVAINIKDNQIGTAAANCYTYSAATTGAFVPIFNSNGAATALLTITGNDIRGIVNNVTGSGAHLYIQNQTFTGSCIISNNTFTNIVANTTGSITFIGNSITRNAASTCTVNNNSIVGTYNKPGAGGTILFYNSFGVSPITMSETNTGNNFSNMTFTGAATITGWRCSDGTGVTGCPKTVTNNTFSNIVGGTALVNILQSSFGTTGTISGNVISNITAGAGITGFTSSSGNNTITQNTITGLSSTAGVVTGLSITGAAASTQSVTRNKIGNLQSLNATGTVNGILVSGGITVNLVNNLIGDLRAPITSSTVDAIRGINITSATALSNINVYYNTININAQSTGVNFNTSGLFHTFNTTATTAALDMRNNVIVNNSTANGTGLTVAFRRSAATNLNNYATTSNNNLFWAGGVGACTSRFIYYDGTTGQQLAGFKALVAPRESASVSEDPHFLSTTASTGNFLHIDPTIPTQIESGAATIGTVTNDFDGDVRSATPDIGADEFSGIIAVACTGTPTAGTATAVSSSICNGQSATICLSGQTPPLDVTIQWKSSLVSGGPYTDVVCANSNCYTTGPLTPGTYYFVAVITCTNSGLSSTSNQVTIIVNGSPTAAITPSAPNVCLGSSVVLTASGGTSYTWSPATGLNTTSGPVVTATPLVTTTYTVTVTDANGCSATATSTVTVSPAPTVTATATPASICSGGSSQLNALACLGNPTSSYSLSNLTGQTYTTLTGAGITIINTNAQLTPTMGGATQDDGGVVITLPFAFTYNCNTFTQMSMCTNGWVGAGNQGTIDAVSMRTAANLFSTTIPNNTIAAWFKDMGANFPLGTGSMRHGLIGTDVYAFQWDNANGSSFGDGATILISFQVNIYGPASVAPGRVEMIYGPTVGAITFSASEGIEDGIGGPNHYINALDGSGTTTTLSTVWPGNGNGYRFNPVTATYSWSPATFLNDTGIPNPLATGVTSTTTYTVTVTSGNGCTGTASVTVTTNPIITITETDMSGIANNDGIICAGSSATLTASGGTTYAWSSGDNTPSTTVSPLVTTIYTVTVTDAAGCSATATSTITVIPFLALNPVLTQPSTCVSTDGAITLTPAPPGTYTFDWADLPGTNDPQNRTGLMVGNYNVSVTNPATGCVTPLSIFLSGPGGCDVCPTITNLTVTPNPVCATNTITLSTTGLTNMGVTYGIVFKSFPAPTATPYTGGTVLATVPNASLTGGGTVATATTSIAVAGTYFIYAVLTPVPTDPQCRPSATTTPLVVNPIPNAVATPPSQTICSGATITTIVLTGNVPNTTFNWTRNNTGTVTGIAAAGSGNISGSLTNTTNAPITVTFTITPTANGCPGTPITATVLVNPTPNAVATPPSQTICSGNPITTIVLSGNVTGAAFNWTRDNVATVTGIPASGSGNISGSLTNTTGAPITVTFTIIPTSTSCPGGSITATVTVNPSPVVNPVANKIYCFHTLVPSIVFNSSAPNAVINWVQTGANIGLAQASGTGFIPSFLGVNNTNGPLTATFTVTATFTNNGVTCTGPPMVFTITICYQLLPTILGDTYVCPGQTVTYSIGNINPNSIYQWILQNGGGVIISQTATSITIQWSNTPGGPFSLELVENGCTNTCQGYAFAPVFIQGVEALACNDNVQISLDQDCLAHVLSGMILEGEDDDNNNYFVQLTDAFGNLIPNATLTSAYLGQLITAKVLNECNGQSCWGTITLEDKIPPTIECQNSTVSCGTSLEPIYIAPISGLASVIKTPLSPIGPNAGTVTTENINMLIPTGGLVQDVNVTIDLDHTWSGDLKADLISPSGTIINLATAICGAADNWDNVTFDDQAMTSILNACNNTPPPAILQGSYIPTQALSTFNGEEAGGIWQLRITDQANADGGTLNLVKLDVLYQESGPFAPVTSDACGDVELSYTDTYTGDPCEAQILTRNWTATDESGNTATCAQILTIVPLQLEDVIFPPAFIGDCGDSDSPDHTGWPTTVDGVILTDANNVCNLFIGYWDQAINDCGGGRKIARHWTILDWCTVQNRQFIQVIKLSDTQGPELTCPNDFEVGTDFWYCYSNVSVPKPGVEDNCSEIANYYLTSSSGTVVSFGNNFVINGLGLGTHTVTWRVTDECGNSSTCSFHITVVDDVVPVANCDAHTVIALTNDGPQGITLIPATVFDDGSYDNCGPVTFRARRMDSCIDIDWTTEGACIDDVPGGVPPVNSRDRGTVHRPCVPFACCDVGAGPIMVELEVTDVAGNKNYCMVEAIVQDKISPFVECPPDIIVSCDFWFNVQEGTFVDETGNNNGNLDEDPLSPVFGNMWDAFKYNDDQSVRQDIIIDDPGSDIQPQPHFWGIDGWADDNCEVNLQVRVRIVADCSGGDLPGNAPDGAVKMIERRFSASDGNDGVAPGTCTQRIWVVDYDPFYITDNTCNNNNPNDGVIWPCDVLLTDCPEDLGDTGEPTVFDDACSLVGVTYEDTRYDFVDGACFKILREWSVIDWCTYGSDGEGGYYGLWHYIQVIKVHDNEGPEFTDCPTGPVTLCVADDGVSLPDNNQVFLGEENPLASSCSVHLNLHHTVHETCSDIVNYDVKLYLNNGDEFIYLKTTTTVTIDENNDADLSFDTRQNPSQQIRLNGIPYNSPFCGDYHRILWSAEDGCGNWSHCEYLIRLEDCKLPSPVCINGLSTVVMPIGGQVTIWAKDFNASSFDDCTPEADLLYSFSGDSYEPSHTYTCDNVEHFNTELPVQIWVADGGTDDNCNGQISWTERNKDFCLTTIVISDNGDPNTCDTTGHFLAGEILTDNVQPVELVAVNLSSPGHLFPVFVTSDNGQYNFNNLQVPADCQVTASRDDNHKNGVSTLDMVRIQKHLLGIETFTDPYQLIAADANNSQSVSAFDLVEIRKLILGIYSQFPANTSWRFVDKSYQFGDPSHPWPFDEVIDIPNMSGDETGKDFIAVKIGDVNNSVQANAQQIKPRNGNGILHFVVNEHSLNKGEMIDLAVRSSDFTSIEGYQFTLITNGLEFLGAESGMVDMSDDNIGSFKGMLTASWHKVGGVSATSSDVLFTLHFRAIEAGHLSEMIKLNSKVTEAEAYNTSDEIKDLKLSFRGMDITADFALYQNEPNPFKGVTVIGFDVPQNGDVTLTVFDVTGKVLLVKDQNAVKGYNTISVNSKELPSVGVMYYRLDAGENSATKKMILIE